MAQNVDPELKEKVADILAAIADAPLQCDLKYLAVTSGGSLQQLSEIAKESSAGRDAVIAADGIKVVLRALEQNLTNANVLGHGVYTLNALVKGSSDGLTKFGEAGGVRVLLMAAAMDSEADWHEFELPWDARTYATVYLHDNDLLRVECQDEWKMGSKGAESLALHVDGTDIVWPWYKFRLAPENVLAEIAQAEIDVVFQRDIYFNLTAAQRIAVSRAVDRAISKANSKYSWLAEIKDTYLPIQDILLDVVNFVTLIMERRYLWLSAILAGMSFNGVGMALMCTIRKDYKLAAANLLTFGVAGLAYESHMSKKAGIKTRMLPIYKFLEGVESTVSFAVTADTIFVAHVMEGYPPLELDVAVLRWASVASSMICLPLLCYDVTIDSIYGSQSLEHLRVPIRSKIGKLQIFLFHFFELAGQLVIVPFSFVTRPYGTIIFVCTAYPLLCLLIWRDNARHLETDGIASTIVEVSTLAGFYLSFNADISKGDQDSLQRIGRQVAILRPVVWTALWVAVLGKISIDEKLKDVLLDSPHALAVLAIAAIGFFGYLAYFAHRWRSGFFDSLKQRHEAINAEASSNANTGSKYELLPVESQARQ